MYIKLLESLNLVIEKLKKIASEYIRLKAKYNKNKEYSLYNRLKSTVTFFLTSLILYNT